MQKYEPLPCIYYPDFIAANQADRANNLKSTGSKKGNFEAIRDNIKNFKYKNNLERVIMLWTANTERFVEVKEGLNMTADEIKTAIKEDRDEVSPSQVSIKK